MSDFYLSGVSEVSKGNEFKAIELWEYAAVEGSINAIESLINIYRLGKDINVTRALYWAEKIVSENPEKYNKIISELNEKIKIKEELRSTKNTSYHDFDSADQSVVVGSMEWGDQSISDMTESDDFY